MWRAYGGCGRPRVFFIQECVVAALLLHLSYEASSLKGRAPKVATRRGPWCLLRSWGKGPRCWLSQLLSAEVPFPFNIMAACALPDEISPPAPGPILATISSRAEMALETRFLSLGSY